MARGNGRGREREDVWVGVVLAAKDTKSAKGVVEAIGKRELGRGNGEEDHLLSSCIDNF